MLEEALLRFWGFGSIKIKAKVKPQGYSWAVFFWDGVLLRFRLRLKLYLNLDLNLNVNQLTDEDSQEVLAGVDACPSLKEFCAYNNGALDKMTRKKLRGFKK